MKPYLVAVVLEPTTKEKEEGGVAKLIVEGKTVLAKDNTQAGTKALKLVGPEYDNLDDRLTVYVLPFVRP